MANFLLGYDLAASLMIQQQLTAFVKTSRNINQWSQPFLGLYLLKSNATVEILSADFRDFFGATSHIIVPISIAQGMLPPYFWTWLNEAEVPVGGLGGLLGLAAPPKFDL